jgi:hypothetical protein
MKIGFALVGSVALFVVTGCTLPNMANPSPDAAPELAACGSSSSSSSSSSGALASAPTAAPTGTPSTFSIVLDGKDYEYSCPSGTGSFGPDWQGPGLDAITQNSGSSCAWPKENPRLTVDVLFTGFVPSVGFTAGTYDVSKAENLVVTAEAASQSEAAVGTPVAYATYSSSSTIDSAGSRGPSTPSPAASGTVIVTRYQPSQNGLGADYDVTLTNVILPVHAANPSFPATLTIRSAHLVSQNE